MRVRRIAATVAVLVTATLAAAGCTGGSGGQEDTRAADPLQAIRILPTPKGLTAAGPARVVDADGLSTAFGSATPIPGLADSGLSKAAVREFTGPGGGRLVVAAALWESNESARGIVGAAAEQRLGESGAQAWTPDTVGGSRGVRLLGHGPDHRTLSFAAGRAGAYLRADGPVPEAAITRTADLLYDGLNQG